MRVLVTGASGFLGSHVVEALKSAGHEARCLVRGSSKIDHLEALGVELVRGALDDPESLRAAVRGVDAIIHSAGLVKARSDAEFRAANVDGTRALADAAVALAPNLKRFVHISTAALMGPSRPGEKLSIDAPPNPQTRYAKSKLEAEHALLELRDKLPITILRPPAIYGPRDAEILAFFKMVRRSRLAIGLGRALREVSMVYGPDAARAAVLAIDKDVPSGAAYFVTDGDVHSFESMARAIAAAYGVGLVASLSVPAPIIRAAAAVSTAYGAAFGKAMMFSTDKLGELLIEHFVVDDGPGRAALGLPPSVDFTEGARLTAQWYREHGWD